MGDLGEGARSTLGLHQVITLASNSHFPEGTWDQSLRVSPADEARPLMVASFLRARREAVNLKMANKILKRMLAACSALCCVLVLKRGQNAE